MIMHKVRGNKLYKVTPRGLVFVCEIPRGMPVIKLIKAQTVAKDYLL